MPTDEFDQAILLTYDTARGVLDWLSDLNVWPFAHVTLVHLIFFCAERGMEHVNAKKGRGKMALEERSDGYIC